MLRLLRPKIKAFGFLVAVGWLPLAAKTLPVLFVPPPHYQVLRRLGNRGYPYFGGNMGSPVDRAIFRYWLRQAHRLGATALLLEPECKTWSCHGWGGFGSEAAPTAFLQKYAAVAIRVEGPACVMPTGLCQRVQPTFVSVQRWERAARNTHEPFGLSVSLTGIESEQGAHASKVRSIRSTIAGHVKCLEQNRATGYPPPVAPRRWENMPVVPMVATVTVNPDGRARLKHLTFTVFGPTYYTEDWVARILRHWRFKVPTRDAHAFELIMDWHLVPLKVGQPIPSGVVCLYPAYPARHWKDGIMVRHHLRWTLGEGKDHTWWAWVP